MANFETLRGSIQKPYHTFLISIGPPNFRLTLGKKSRYLKLAALLRIFLGRFFWQTYNLWLADAETFNAETVDHYVIDLYT